VLSRLCDDGRVFSHVELGDEPTTGLDDADAVHPRGFAVADALKLVAITFVLPREHDERSIRDRQRQDLASDRPCRKPYEQLKNCCS